MIIILKNKYKNWKNGKNLEKHGNQESGVKEIEIQCFDEWLIIMDIMYRNLS